MRKILVPSMLIFLAMICSCQKQDSAVEQQLAQRKTELDAREDALIEKEKVADEREKALDERERALAERENAAANARTTAPAVQASQIPDASQANAERDRRLQQLPPEFRTLIPDRSKVTAGDPAKQARRAPRQLGPEDLQRQWEGKLNKAKMSGEAVSPAAEAGSPTPSPAVDANAVIPSATPE